MSSTSKFYHSNFQYCEISYVFLYCEVLSIHFQSDFVFILTYFLIYVLFTIMMIFFPKCCHLNDSNINIPKIQQFIYILFQSYLQWLFVSIILALFLSLFTYFLLWQFILQYDIVSLLEKLQLCLAISMLCLNWITDVQIIL